MTKSELIALMAERGGLTRKQAGEQLDTLTGILTEAAGKGDSITLPGFGVFKLKTRPARTGRNPATGGTVEIAEKRTLTFKASSALKL